MVDQWLESGVTLIQLEHGVEPRDDWSQTRLQICEEFTQLEFRVHLRTLIQVEASDAYWLSQPFDRDGRDVGPLDDHHVVDFDHVQGDRGADMDESSPYAYNEELVSLRSFDRGVVQVHSAVGANDLPIGI